MQDNVAVPEWKQTLSLCIHLSSSLFVFQQSPRRGAEPAPPSAPCPAHSLRRLPQCPPVHISRPVPVSVTLSVSPGPVQPRPPVPPHHLHAAAASRGASFGASCRMVMVSEFICSL